MSHRILVVDDEESIRTLLKEFFEARGYLVVAAADADEAERLFESRKCHLALIDYLLPRRDGFAVAQSIRNHPTRSDTPIILMSGVFKNPKTVVEARERYNVVDFLSKPVDLERLAVRVGGTLASVPADAEADEPPPLMSRSIDIQMNPGDPAAAEAMAALKAVKKERPPPRGLSYGPGTGSAVKARSTTRASTSPSPSPEPAPRAPSRGPSMASGRVEGGRWLGRPFPELEEEGELGRFPLAMLLSAIRYDKATGMLDLNHGATHRRIYLMDGRPTFMQSNYEGENVGALLLRRGRITEPDFERCLRYMKEEARTLQQSLLELKLVTEPDLATAYKLLAGQLLPSALGMASGKYRWRETDAFVGRVPEGNFEPVSVLLDGIKRYVHPPQIFSFFQGREDMPLLPTELFEPLMPHFRRAYSADNVSSEIDGSSTFRRLSRVHTADAAQVMPQLFALVASGMVVAPEPDTGFEMMAAVEAAAFSVGKVDELMSDEPEMQGSERQKLVAAIDAYHRRVMSMNFFEIFDSDPDSEESALKARYFELARKWHSDAFQGHELGPHQRKLDEIFQRITEAYNTLTDKVQREEYLIYLDRKAKGLPTDVNEILKGEQLFDQATAMIKRREWVKACEVLEEAIRKNPDPLYLAHLGWATYKRDPNQQANVTKGVQYLKRAVKEQENLPVAYQFLGQLCHARGHSTEARKWWTRCLEWDPHNVDAQRGLRTLAQAKGEKSPQGSNKGNLLNRFLSKK